MYDRVLNPGTMTLLHRLSPDDLPEGTYLAGGTAVALYLGHRRSADLDFFTPVEFTELQWEAKLSQNIGFTLLKRDWQTLIGNVDKVKFSLFSYRYKQISPVELYENIPIASVPDLAAMKLDTIIGRGSKRDFIDIYFLAQKHSLEELFSFYQSKYNNFEERYLMLKKALVYFGDADKDEMPDMLVPANWPQIKKWFVESVKRLNRSL
jgi:predicted nucleotidyltransferase component of viral defense system